MGISVSKSVLVARGDIAGRVVKLAVEAGLDSVFLPEFVQAESETTRTKIMKKRCILQDFLFGSG